MGEKELLFAGKKTVRPSDDWAEGRGHLQTNQDKNQTPQPHLTSGCASQEASHRPNQTQPRPDRDDPKDQVQSTHERDGISRLGKDPGNRREPDQKQGTKGNRRKKNADDGAQSDVDSSQTGEDVETGEANQDRKKGREGKFGRGNPHLSATGKTTDDQAVGSHADQSKSKQPTAQAGAPIILQFVDDAAGKFQERLDNEQR